jgi:hypothetical protein
MARYKDIDTSPRFLAVDLERQLLPGTFEYALNIWWIADSTCRVSMLAIAMTWPVPAPC